MRTDNHARERRFPGAVLFDRDGTLVEDAGYASSPDQITLLPGVARALRRLQLAGARLFVVSNQSGVGRGRFGPEAVRACNARLAELLAGHGVGFDAMLFCPHAPEERCICRKPATGMWEELRATFGLCPKDTAMIGDKRADLDFGRAAGLAASVLVLTGRGEEEARALGLALPASGFSAFSVPRAAAPGPGLPHAAARDMEAAAEYLLYPARRAIT